MQKVDLCETTSGPITCFDPNIKGMKLSSEPIFFFQLQMGAPHPLAVIIQWSLNDKYKLVFSWCSSNISTLTCMLSFALRFLSSFLPRVTIFLNKRLTHMSHMRCAPLLGQGWLCFPCVGQWAALLSLKYCWLYKFHSQNLSFWHL